MKSLAFISFVVFILFANAQPAIPDLPQEFSAEVTVTVPFFGDIPGTLYFDYLNNVQRVDQKSAFGTTITVSDYNVGKEYTIQGGSCEMTDLQGDFYPMAVPPFATFVGNETVNDILCEHWNVDFSSITMDYYVSASTSAGKTSFTIVRFVTGGLLNIQYNFETVTPGPQDSSLFDVSQWGCPPPVPPPTYNVGGYVKNALNNQVIPGASLTLNTGAETTANAQGAYSFTSLPVGEYNITATASGFITGEIVFNLTQDIQPGTSADFVLSPVLKPGTFRAVLTWASLPADLDSHLQTPGCQIYYANRVCSAGSLDFDWRAGYGPETITINNAPSSGSYTYFVYIYSSGSFMQSNARVQLFNSDGLLLDLRVPSSGYPPTSRTWNVFQINTGGSVQVLNTFS